LHDIVHTIYAQQTDRCFCFYTVLAVGKFLVDSRISVNWVSVGDFSMCCVSSYAKARSAGLVFVCDLGSSY